jgi:hypothetical protein
MSINPYTAPTTSVITPPKAASATKAILIGLSIDIGGTLLIGMLFGLFLGIYAASQDMSAEEIAAMTRGTDSVFFIVSTAIGLVMSVLGGYVCARRSCRTDYKLGFILAGLSTSSGFLLMLIQTEKHTPLIVVGLSLLTFSSILLGTKLGCRKNVSQFLMEV